MGENALPFVPDMIGILYKEMIRAVKMDGGGKVLNTALRIKMKMKQSELPKSGHV